MFRLEVCGGVQNMYRLSILTNVIHHHLCSPPLFIYRVQRGVSLFLRLSGDTFHSPELNAFSISRSISADRDLSRSQWLVWEPLS